MISRAALQAAWFSLPEVNEAAAVALPLAVIEAPRLPLDQVRTLPDGQAQALVLELGSPAPAVSLLLAQRANNSRRVGAFELAKEQLDAAASWSWTATVVRSVALELFSFRASLAYDLGDLAVAEGSLAYAEGLAIASPERARVLAQRGMVARAGGDPREGAVLTAEAIRLGLSGDTFAVGLALMLAESGQPVDAREILGGLPDDPTAVGRAQRHWILGLVAFEDGREDPIPHLEAAVEGYLELEAWGQMALVSVDHVRVQLARGEFARAALLARGAARLLMTLGVPGHALAALELMQSSASLDQLRRRLPFAIATNSASSHPPS